MNSFKEMFKMAFGIGCGVIASFLAIIAVFSMLAFFLGGF